MIAALYVDPKGVYDRPGVDVWGLERDARRYTGPWPVVAHPPCARWCLMAGFVQSVYGYKVGDDGGCFEAALAAVRAYGGVLEHPAFTKAWPAFGLPEPTIGAWRRTLFDSGWVTEVWQLAYGHPARKKTWLYYVGHAKPPPLRWAVGRSDVWVGYGDTFAAERKAQALAPVAKVGNFRFRSKSSPIAQGPLSRKRVTKKEAAATPPAFADALIALAEGAR